MNSTNADAVTAADHDRRSFADLDFDALDDEGRDALRAYLDHAAELERAVDRVARAYERVAAPLAALRDDLR